MATNTVQLNPKWASKFSTEANANSSFFYAFLSLIVVSVVGESSFKHGLIEVGLCDGERRAGRPWPELARTLPEATLIDDESKPFG